MRNSRVCLCAATLSLVMAGSVFAGISPDGRGGVAYTGSPSLQTSMQSSAISPDGKGGVKYTGQPSGMSPDGRGGVVYQTQTMLPNQAQLTGVSPDGQGGTIYYTTSGSASGAASNPYLGGAVNHTGYTTNYTGTTGGYYVNGVLYHTVNIGPMAGNQASAGLSQVTNPAQMNPAGTNYSSSSTVINTRRVVANTYLHTGWQFENNGMWYLYQDGTYPVSSWRTIDGTNYHFNSGGYLEVNTWIYEANGAWYYVGADAKIVRGLQKINGRLYYFEPGSGQLKGPGLLLADGKYFFAGQDGALIQDAWVGSFFFGADGARVN